MTDLRKVNIAPLHAFVGSFLSTYIDLCKEAGVQPITKGEQYTVLNTTILESCKKVTDAFLIFLRTQGVELQNQDSSFIEVDTSNPGDL